MKNYFSKLAGVMLVALPFLMSSCGEDEVPAPTISFSFEIDDHTVTFTSAATDVDTYSWEVGDGETSTEANPVHTYAKGGEYTITCVVKGGGGEDLATQKLTIEASDEELLTGTWAVDGSSTVIAAEIDGEDQTAIGAGMIATMIPDIVADHFVFNEDGSYKVEDDGNGFCFSAVISAMATIQVADPCSDDRIAGDCDVMKDYAICAFQYAIPNDATWEIKTGDIVINEGTDDEHKFEDVKYIELSEGAFLGMYNIPNYVIINELTATSLNVTLMFNADSSNPAVTNYTVTLSFTK
jgi:PKD repeat protein